MMEDGLSTGRRLGRPMTGEVLVRVEMSIQTCKERYVSGLTRPCTLIILKHVNKDYYDRGVFKVL